MLTTICAAADELRLHPSWHWCGRGCLFGIKGPPFEHLDSLTLVVDASDGLRSDRAEKRLETAECPGHSTGQRRLTRNHVKLLQVQKTRTLSAMLTESRWFDIRNFIKPAFGFHRPWTRFLVFIRTRASGCAVYRVYARAWISTQSEVTQFFEPPPDRICACSFFEYLRNRI